MMTIRQTRTEDIAALLRIFAAARRFMADTGNPNQWRNGYPSEEIIANDISRGNSHVVEDSTHGIVGTFCFIIGEDPTYKVIEGNWKNNLPYGTIHRIASDGRCRGIADACLEWCLRQIDNIRIDTHADNRVMQRWIEKQGFEYCGIIHVADGSPRKAYQRYRKGIIPTQHRAPS